MFFLKMEAFCILNSALDQSFCLEVVKITNINMCAEFQSYSTELSLFFAGISEKMKKTCIFSLETFCILFLDKDLPNLNIFEKYVFSYVRKTVSNKKRIKFHFLWAAQTQPVFDLFGYICIPVLPISKNIILKLDFNDKGLQVYQFWGF